MKKNTLQQRIKFTVVAGLAGSCLWAGSHLANAEDIPIANHSFEEHDLQGDDTLGTEVIFYPPMGWTSYGAGPGIVIGTLFPHHSEDSTLYDQDEPTPDGNRVLVLFNGNASGGEPFGVEKVLIESIEGGFRYTLTVDVGNIASSNLLFEGFPIYRLQLFAGDMEVPLEQDFASLDIEEGEFETSTLIVDIPLDSPLIGNSLRLQLQNENNALDLVPNNRNEVNFDNVRLTMEPLSEPLPSIWDVRNISAEKIDIATSSYEEEGVMEIDFNVRDYHERVFVIGTGLSMNTCAATVTNLAIAPEVRIINRITGDVIDENDDWLDSSDENVFDLLSDLVSFGNHNLLHSLSVTDASQLLLLGEGQYTAQLICEDEENVYAGLKIFGYHSPTADGSVSFPGLTEFDLEETFNPKQKPEFKKFEIEKPTRKTPTRTKQDFTTKSTLRK